MITIKNIRIVEKTQTSRLQADISCPEFENTIWYEVNLENAKYFTYELADCFVVPFLPLAIKNNWNIVVEDTPVSAKLLFNINNFLIPSLNGKCQVIAQPIELDLGTNRKNGSGMSCGVDSFYTLYQCYFQNEIESLKMNSLTFLNVGAHDAKTNKEARELFLERSKKSQKVAEELEFDFLLGDSNIHEILKESFVTIHSYRNIGFILALQKKYQRYYYSSGHSIYEFNILGIGPAYYDVFLLPILSTENTTFISTGCVEKRIEKIEKIADYDIVQNHMLVCFREEDNCCYCEKCMRTIYALWAIDKLDMFKSSFGIKDFEQYQKKLDYKFMSHVYNQENDYLEIYEKIKEKNKKIKLNNKIFGFIYHIGRDLIKNRKKKIQY